MAGNKPPEGHPNWVPYAKNGAGELLWGPPGKVVSQREQKMGYRAYSGGSGGGKGGSDAKTEAEIKAEKAWHLSIESAYRVYVGDSDAAIPSWLKNLKYDKRTKYTPDYIKLMFEEHKVLSKDQTDKLRGKLRSQLQFWGVDVSDPEIKKLLDQWEKRDVGKMGEYDMANFIQNKLSKTKQFGIKFPQYAEWAERYQAESGGAANPQLYLDYVKELKASWASVFGADVPPDDTWIQTAIALGWTKEQLQAEVKKGDQYKNTAGQQFLIQEFNGVWDGIFGGTAFDNPNFRNAMLDKFRLSGMQFDVWFDTYMQTSPEFSNAVSSVFPEFAAYHLAFTTKYPGKTVNIATFMERRGEIQDLFQDTLENYEMQIPKELLTKALAEGWTDNKLEHYLKSAPEFRDTYLKTEGARREAVSFTKYWKRIFGLDATPDAGLLSQYIIDGSGDPTAFFDEIRQTSEFQAQYGMWDEFAAAVTEGTSFASAADILDDPSLYKRYLDMGTAAFANVGLNINEGYLRNFFRSGIDPTDLESNLNDWLDTNFSFTWQSGETADVTTASGIGNKEAGGGLRIRMKEALAQHKAYAQSRFNQFQTQENLQNQVIRKV